MNLLEKRPGELFALVFIIAGIVLTLTVSVVQGMSGTAGRGFNDGLINGAGNWTAETR